jgi:antitoxin MazE
METYIHQWGNSMGLRIPMKLAKRLNLHVGSAVEIDLKDNYIKVTPKKYNLYDMIKKINKGNVHEELLSTVSTGGEVW